MKTLRFFLSKKQLLCCCISLWTLPLLAQTPQPAAQGDTLRWFDFWVGDWDLMWYVKDSIKLYGENRIEKILGGTTIQENFAGLTRNTKGYEGKSLSIYNSNTKQWQQTWVDNQNTYILFVGGREEESYFFENQRPLPNGKTIAERMVFHHIKPDAFTWDWKSSTDGGKTWAINWQIFYTRKPKVSSSFEQVMKKVISRKQYFLVYLKTGPNQTEDEKTNNEIQKNHLLYLFKLRDEDKMPIFGSLFDESDIKGICIYNVATQEEALKLASNDPAVKSGRFVVEVHPWLGLPGDGLH